MEQNENTGDILIYQSENGLTRIDVRLEQETVWLTNEQVAKRIVKIYEDVIKK